MRISLTCKRNIGFYGMTLFIPVILLTFLAPIGLILPAGTGEKMGLQITVMLTIVIYIDVIQNSIPVYGSIMETPLLLSNFVTTTCLLTACLLVSTRTLFLEHVQLYEVCNFTRQRAKDSVNIGW